VNFERTIAHLDMDAFYASVELRRRPELKGKPVVVCGSGPRAVVTTASYEARKLAGIQSAMPAAVARRRLPNAIYLRPDFPAYREASAQVMDVLRGNVEVVEVVGLDEAYLNLTGLFSPKAVMRKISTMIWLSLRARRILSRRFVTGCACFPLGKFCPSKDYRPTRTTWRPALKAFTNGSKNRRPF